VLFLADFFDTLLRGAVLVGISLALGGVAWALWVLRPWQRRAPQAAVGLDLTLVCSGAATVATGQALLLILKFLALSESFDADVLGSFVVTLHFLAAGARILVALAVTTAVLWLRHAPDSAVRWLVVTVLSVALAASGAWLTHATGRLEDRPALMTLTALHQTAASVWAGGLLQLAGYWWLARRQPLFDALWPELVGRFSRLALTSVIVLVLTALPVTWKYTASVSGLVGTGYGALVLTKVALLGAALLLAAFNWRTARRAGEPRAPAALRTRLPYLVEAEAIILVMILLTAATLSAQPPSADLTAAHRATVGEVVEVFRPKLPSLRTPSVEIMRMNRAATAGAMVERSRAAYLWSNYSHNVAGLILLGMSLVALGGPIVRPAVARQWPLGFVALAAFLYLRAAANEGTWPFGALGLWEVGAEGVQHRIAAILVLGLGVLEWRARAHPERSGLLPCVLPALAAAGAVLLLTHSHTAFQAKSSFLVQVTHTTMGALAVLLVAARWLELRLGPPANRLAGAAASGAMLMIALVLVFYREANVVIPPD
jgi:copper resistance protein D